MSKHHSYLILFQYFLSSYFSISFPFHAVACLKNNISVAICFCREFLKEAGTAHPADAVFVT